VGTTQGELRAQKLGEGKAINLPRLRNRRKRGSEIGASKEKLWTTWVFFKGEENGKNGVKKSTVDH